MKKIHFSIHINAPKEKVWQMMLDDATYRRWTAVFNPSGSYYEGTWEEGVPIRFLGPNPDGTVSGMRSKIKVLRPYEYVSIQHIGEIINGQEKPWRAELHLSGDFFENYSFSEENNGTKLEIELDSNEAFEEMFQELWPKSLQVLKEISESTSNE